MTPPEPVDDFVTCASGFSSPCASDSVLWLSTVTSTPQDWLMRWCETERCSACMAAQGTVTEAAHTMRQMLMPDADRLQCAPTELDAVNVCFGKTCS
jgi:hypothetical protein